MPDPVTIEQIKAQIDILLDRIPEEPDPGGDDAEKMPKYRFRQVNEKLKAARDAIKAFEAGLTDVESRHASELENLRTELTGQFEQEKTQIQTTWQENLALTQAGFDDTGIRTLRNEWQALPEDKRGESPIAWWEQQTEAHKAHLADKEKPAPKLGRALAVYLPTPEPEAPAQPSTPTRSAPFFSVDGNRSKPGPQPGAAERIAAAKTREEREDIYRELDG